MMPSGRVGCSWLGHNVNTDGEHLSFRLVHLHDGRLSKFSKDVEIDTDANSVSWGTVIGQRDGYTYRGFFNSSSKVIREKFKIVALFHRFTKN